MWRYAPLALVATLPVCSTGLSQNLLTNPGFEHDLSGWQPSTYTSMPGTASAATVNWDRADARNQPDSGSLHLKLFSFQSIVSGRVSQCVPVRESTAYFVSARFRLYRQHETSLYVRVSSFATAGCDDPAAAQPLGSIQALALPPSCFSSNGTEGGWVERDAVLTMPPGARSAWVSADVSGTGTQFCGGADVDGNVDDIVFMPIEPQPSVSWVLPAVARVAGAGGSFWTTDLWFTNGSDLDGFATLRFTRHDTNGRLSPYPRGLRVPARSVVSVKDVLGTSFGIAADWGALFVGASPGVALLAENSTPSCNDGAVGEAVPAFAAGNLIGAAPESLFPIRQTAAHRTNLILANATERPLTVHLKLLSVDGAVLGEEDVALLPLGMTQLNEIPKRLGATELDAGRLEVSTATPDGHFAAYASLIDNGTNDPRALLPR